MCSSDLTVGNRAAASRLIAERTSDIALARRALADLEEAGDVLRMGGHTPGAAFCEEEAEKARALIARLEGG